LSPLHRAVLYALFGGVSIAVNLTVQWVSHQVLSGRFSIELSILFGTIAGLPVKFFLDRRYIFSNIPRARRSTTEFVLYSVTGIFTTLIFWGTEWVFHLIFATDIARLSGGALGLTIGFVVKYQLDKRWVFSAPWPEARSG
jgi:putative flippase GtrA